MEHCEFWDQDGCYCVCGAMCSCEHRVGKYVADYSSITPAEITQSNPELDALFARSRESGTMVALSRVQNVIDRWHIKTMGTQFSGPEYHVCDGQDSWGIVGRVFKDREKAEAELSKLRAEAVQKLFS